MKKRSLTLSALVLVCSSIVVFSACRKVNEATELGGDLIPQIDNITTFETYFSTETDNLRFNDTSTLSFTDNVAIGNLNDPEFGATNASAYFTLSAANYGVYPFINKDSVQIDSVVLSLAYRGAYGDTNALQNVKVYEIAPTSTFNDATLYTSSIPDIETAGTVLGQKSFAFNQLNDSVTLIRKRDTSKVANVLRIRLDNSLGQRFVSYSETAGANGAFNNDTTFKTLFKGLAVKADGGNGLGYFSLSNSANTKLTFYFRVVKNGAVDTTATEFYHTGKIPSSSLPTAGGQANIIRRTESGNWAAALNNATSKDELIYLQSVPGSYAAIRIPALDTLSNYVIHRAELIATRIPSAMDNVLTPPSQLFLDKFNNNKDTAFILPDLSFSSLSANFSTFGGQLLSNNIYRFNVTRYVQNLISQKEPNTILRLYAPYTITPFSSIYNTKIRMQVGTQPAYGRVVLAGGNYADPAMRLRLRIVYSKI